MIITVHCFISLALSTLVSAGGSAPPTNPPKGAQRPDNQSSAPQGPKAPPASPAAKDGLDTDFLDFELLGMRFRPPTGSVMRAEGTGATATWIVSERADPPRFVLRITRLVASEATSTPAKQIDAYVKSVSERPAPNAVFAVRARKEFDMGGRPAAILYTSLREGTGDDEISAVQGYFMLQVAPNEFMVISALLAESDYASMSSLLERSFRTMEVVDPRVLAKDRTARMERGDHLLKGLDEEALRRVLDPVASKGALPAPHWFRISRSDANGEVQEVGYMTMVAIEAAQGVANPDRRENEWTTDEREMGLLVRVQVRTLLDATGTAVSDTDGRYWVRWDRGRELWTVRTTMRKGKSNSTSSQLGIRTAPVSGSPRPMLEVADVVPSAAASAPRRWPVPAVGYLSQAEALLLTRLFPKSDTLTEYGFYWFDARSGRVAQRVDRVVPGAGGVTVFSQPTLESPAIEQRLDSRGDALRRTGDDGSIVEATTGEALLALWKKKGLPIQ
jgi:hypothetical protein